MSPALLTVKGSAITPALPLKDLKEKRLSKAIPIVKPTEDLAKPVQKSKATTGLAFSAKGPLSGGDQTVKSQHPATQPSEPESSTENITGSSNHHIEEKHKQKLREPIPLAEAGIRAPNFSVYATPYVPNEIRGINQLPAQSVYTRPSPGIDYDQYVTDFVGRRFIPQPLASASLDMQSTDLPVNLRFPDTLSPQNYRSYWATALATEIAALREECDQLALWNVQLLFDGDLVLKMPGLAEGRLRIEAEDHVSLRQLQWGRHPRKQTIFTSFTGLEHVALVKAIDRRQETLRLRVCGKLSPGSLQFNVRFHPQERRLASLSKAVTDIWAALPHDTNITSENSWLNNMLFPRSQHGIEQTRLDTGTLAFTPQDSLNLEQLRAVDAIVKHNYGVMPFLVDGPPGTGKTMTMVETILQLTMADKTANILVCAPSDPAADTLVSRLKPHFAPGQLLRLNDPFRTFAEVPETLLMYCCIDNNRFSLPSFSDVMKCRIVVTTCRDSCILEQARLTNTALAELEHGLRSALHPTTSMDEVQLHWTALVIDEAAQATELEALIPISVVRPPRTIPYSQSPSFIMAGDPRQLNPRTASKEIAIETSLFARLLDRDCYSQHPLTRSKLVRGERPILTKSMLPMLRPAFATLVRNYRSHPAILSVPSALFYNDSLIPEAPDPKALMSSSIWCGRGWPILFVQNNKTDDIESEGGGWYNTGEAHLALQHAIRLLKDCTIEQKDIAIIAPFAAQVRRLRTLARSPQYNLWGVNIGPLEAFQGLESRAVILCTTRTRDRFLDQDLAHGFGVIREAKRFNVALTRARQGLVVIGNAKLLWGADGNWKTFLGFCGRNGLADESAMAELSRLGSVTKEGEAEGVGDVPTHVSRLETASLYAEDRVQTEDGGGGRGRGNHNGGSLRFGGVDQEEAMYASALAAEAALREE